MFGFGTQSRSSWLVRNRPSAPIAADFGRSSVRLLQLAPGATEYRCTAAAEIPGSPFEGNGHKLDPQVLASRIHDAIRGLGFGGQRIAATLPAELFQTDIARLPAMSDKELTDSVRYEAIDRFGIDGDRSVIGHLRLGATAGGSNDVLMMVLPREVVDTASAALSSNDTLAFRVEHAALSALRAVTRQRASECADPAESRDYAMIHLEDRVATLILLRDGAVSFLRAIRGDWAPVGMTMHRRTTTGRIVSGDAAIAVDGVPMDDSGTAWRWCSLAEESLRCLRHFERTAGGWWPREIVLTGPAATDPQAAATVESVCGVRASLAVPIRMVDEPEACMHGNEWIAAIGSACAELPALVRNVRAEPQPVAQSRTEIQQRTAAGMRTAVRAPNTGTIQLDPQPKPAPAPTNGAAA